MPSTDPQNHNDAELQKSFTVAKLALWAGDYLTAEANLRRAAAPHRRMPPGSPQVEDLTAVSARRSLRQLQRRRNEFEALAQSAGIPQQISALHPAMQSAGNHLAGVIWPESEREYELRCYVRDLSWEAEFYKMAARLSGEEDAFRRARHLGYGVGALQEPVTSILAPDESAALDIAWGMTLGQLALRVEISDFCTCTARGSWLVQALPENIDDIISPYQEFLSKLDPAP
jgi:hypothetical protein